VMWILGAVALQTPGARDLRGDIQRSVILQRLNKLLPPSGPILNALARFDPVPRITGPPADVSPPPPAIARAPGVSAAGGSVVKVLGTACGLGIEGSGWVAGPGVVVTNAHVVAGEEDTTVQVRGRGPPLSAHAIRFDSRNDVAVLRVEGLEERALSFSPVVRSGTPGAVLGFPNDGPYDVEAARIGETQTAISQDAYGHGPVTRPITSFRGLVREGNSGGPLVDASGRVLATVFAATVGGAKPGGYGVPDSVVRDALANARGRVGTGQCAS
jgi:S1-C subfamily serine protease